MLTVPSSKQNITADFQIITGDKEVDSIVKKLNLFIL